MENWWLFGLAEQNSDEKTELNELERLADARIDFDAARHPSESDEIQRAMERLKREGKWPESLHR